MDVSNAASRPSSLCSTILTFSLELRDIPLRNRSEQRKGKAPLHMYRYVKWIPHSAEGAGRSGARCSADSVVT